MHIIDYSDSKDFLKENSNFFLVIDKSGEWGAL